MKKLSSRIFLQTNSHFFFLIEIFIKICIKISRSKFNIKIFISILNQSKVLNIFRVTTYWFYPINFVFLILIFITASLSLKKKFYFKISTVRTSKSFTNLKIRPRSSIKTKQPLPLNHPSIN